MTGNAIKTLRSKKGLTQRQLAEMAGTSQQQVQRIEAGVQDARLELAKRLADALGSPLSEVFPSQRTSDSRGSIPIDIETDPFEEAGIDPDPSMHTVLIGLEGGDEHAFIVSSREAKRIQRCFLSKDREGFVVFDTSSHRHAVNYDQITYGRFLFDPGMEEPEVDDDPRSEMDVWFKGASEPVAFGIDYDVRGADPEDPGNLGGMFFNLETPFYEDEPITFEDEDGEDVILFRRQVSLMSVPLEYTSLELLDAQIEGMREDEEL